MSAEAERASGSFDQTVRPFLKTYCVRCHSGRTPKGDRHLDRLSGRLETDNDLVEFQDILDQLNLGEMPPRAAKQPSDEQRRRVVAWLTAAIERFHQQRKATGGETVLRRLNAREYRNTVRDLLQLNVTMFDPTATFPRDQTVDHLDNVGATLVTSGFLLQRYLDAADSVIDKALFPLNQPDVQTWTFRDGFRQQPEIDQVHRFSNEFEYMTLYEVVGADKHEGAYGPIHAFAEGVPYDGYYEIRLRAEALNRHHPYDPEFFGTDPEEPFRLGIVPGDHKAGQLHKPQPVEPLLTEIELADELKWYTVRVWLDAGYTPRFTFRNGPMDVRSMYARLLRKYPDKFPDFEALPERQRKRGIVGHRCMAIMFGKLPQIRIHEIEIRGPIYDRWPRASQQAALGDDCRQVLQSGMLSNEQMRRQLGEFVGRAYRRPARREEIDRLMEVIEERRASGRPALAAYSDGLKAVLCSPSFLYLEEPADGERLSSQGLASRLSYFLWASMPDEELFGLAASGELQKPEVLRAQVDRMLNDPRSDDFIEGFLGSWLTLRDLGSSPPDRNAFREFYQYDLDRAMRRETHLFTRHLIDQNLSIVNFLDSDFTFANKALARMYGVQPPEGNGFEKVRLTDARRGGLLGQASVLTVTANGIDTSPVVRGVWLLENILGTPPSPPPADVPPLDPDVRGAKTIRDQLQKHRDNPSCYDCHRKIDPLGFALEHFDPVGNWRKAYQTGGEIDASGELPSGASFNGVEGLKEVLVDQKQQFSRSLTAKLLAYGVGREMEPADRPEIDRIVRDLADRGDGLRDLIELVVLSEPFRSK